MSDNPINDMNNEEKPEQPPIPEDKGLIHSPNEADDPLYRLRRALLDEESKEEPPPEPTDLLHRVSKGIKGRRTQPKPKTEDPAPAPRYGVQSAFEPVFPKAVSTSIVVHQPQSAEIQDEFLEKRLGTGPLNQNWRRPASIPENEVTYEASENDREVSEYLSGTQPATNKFQSPFSISLSKVTAPNWEDSQQGTTGDSSDLTPVVSAAPTEPIKLESNFSYIREERKALPAGGDKKTQPGPFIAYKPATSLGHRFRSLSPVEKILIMALVVAILGVATMIGYLFVQSRTAVVNPDPVKAVQPSVTPAGVPIPVNLRLTGGLNFPLQRSTMVKGKWLPVGSEWLEGTEIRRVVGIPWNKQTEAVIQTMATNDKIELVMNNGDILNYIVQSVGQVPAQDTSILYDTKLSLIIVLINPDDENRWVIIAYP